MSHRERVPAVAHSLAFFPGGRALWSAHRGMIAIRAWPSLELLDMPRIACARLAAHPVDPTILAVVRDDVVELDERAQVVRRIGPSGAGKGVVALAGDGRGRVTVARTWRSGRAGLAVARIGGDAGDEQDLGRFELAMSWWWWCALLPETKQLVVAVNDSAPEHFDFGDGTVTRDWSWPARWDDRPRTMPRFGSGRRSWLSVDAAPDERCLVASDKGSETTVLWLDGLGRIKDLVALEKRDAIPSPAEERMGRFITKGPNRGAAHAVHPQEEVVVTVDIRGRLTVNDARTGAVLDVADDLYGAGYRGDGLGTLEAEP